MIASTLKEAFTAYGALRRINDDVKMPAKAAYRVSRLMAKISSALRPYDAAQVKLILDHGGSRTPNGAELGPLQRDPKDTDEQWQQKIAEGLKNRESLSEALRELGQETVEIDYDPLPVDLFGESEVSANDFADLGPFIA